MRPENNCLCVLTTTQKSDHHQFPLNDDDLFIWTDLNCLPVEESSHAKKREKNYRRWNVELIDTAQESVKYAVWNRYGHFLLQFNRGASDRHKRVESDHIADIL